MLKKITSFWELRKARKAEEARIVKEQAEKEWKIDYDARQREALRKAQSDAAAIDMVPTIFEERYK